VLSWLSVKITCSVNYPWQLENSFDVRLSQIRLISGQKMVESEVTRIQRLSNHKEVLSQNQFELRISATCRKEKD